MSGKRKGNFSGYAPYMNALKRAKKTAAPPAMRTAAARARSRAQAPRGFLGKAGEAKFFDSAIVQPLNTTGSVNHLDIVPTGTTVSSRDGRRFKNTAVQLRGFLTADSATTTSVPAMYLVWDYQPNKALAAVTDILDSANSTSFSKRENASRFKIIKKWRWVLAGNNTTAGQQTDQTAFDIDDYVKLPDDCIADCTVADTTGAIGNRVTGALLLITVGNVAAGAADGAVTVNTRVNFVDI